jgi:hypothetical protein
MKCLFLISSLEIVPLTNGNKICWLTFNRDHLLKKVSLQSYAYFVGNKKRFLIFKYLVNIRPQADNLSLDHGELYGRISVSIHMIDT